MSMSQVIDLRFLFASIACRADLQKSSIDVPPRQKPELIPLPDSARRFSFGFLLPSLRLFRRPLEEWDPRSVGELNTKGDPRSANCGLDFHDRSFCNISVRALAPNASQWMIQRAMKATNFNEVFAHITTFWDPHIVGELNGQLVKCVKLKGEFVWHKHDAEDELFLVHRGTLYMRLRTEVVTISDGEFFVVPRGIEHQPYASGEVEVVLFEPASTLNTGNVKNAFTKETLKRFPS
jgi:mannose-6-phosphate isomerase-like protein (cupin superfamily)